MKYKLSKEMKRELRKKFIKEKKGWFIGTGLFLVSGIVLLLVGFQISGWSIIDWLKSPYAVTFFIILGIGVFCGIMLFLLWYKHSLGGIENVD